MRRKELCHVRRADPTRRVEHGSLDHHSRKVRNRRSAGILAWRREGLKCADSRHSRARSGTVRFRKSRKRELHLAPSKIFELLKRRPSPKSPNTGLGRHPVRRSRPSLRLLATRGVRIMDEGRFSISDPIDLESATRARRSRSTSPMVDSLRRSFWGLMVSIHCCTRMINPGGPSVQFHSSGRQA